MLSASDIRRAIETHMDNIGFPRHRCRFHGARLQILSKGRVVELSISTKKILSERQLRDVLQEISALAQTKAQWDGSYG